ncbi:MAG: 4-phosphoerythronate dehydrogenase [Bacteroidales bacterium]
MKIVADNKIPFLMGMPGGVAELIFIPGREISRENIIDADALIVRTRTKCNEKLLSGTSVKFIASATIGFDHIDIEYCNANGIGWTNAPGCNSGSVMQYIASALSWIAISSGKSFGELILGIVGVGNVGSKVEHLGRTLGMKVLMNDPPRQRSEGEPIFSELKELLEQSDIVTMHVPLNFAGPDKSYHLADENFFSNMKKGSWFINTSRGEVMHSRKLSDSLRKGHLGGTVLDVWENEPEIDLELLSLAGISTPHIAGYSLDGKANGTAQSVSSVSRHFSLGIDDWYPDNVPPPSGDIITITSEMEDLDQVAGKLFKHTYNIEADSAMLRSAPGKFEYFRDNYHPRREFGAYKINFENPLHPYNDIFRKLGFRV